MGTALEQLIEASDANSGHPSTASSSGAHLAFDDGASSLMSLDGAEHDDSSSTMLGVKILAERAADQGTLSPKPAGPNKNQLADATLAAGDQSTAPVGSMVVFGGESTKGCYLDDVWVLHLNSLMWQELSRPVACQKRCRSMLEQN